MTTPEYIKLSLPEYSFLGVSEYSAHYSPSLMSYIYVYALNRCHAENDWNRVFLVLVSNKAIARSSLGLLYATPLCMSRLLRRPPDLYVDIYIYIVLIGVALLKKAFQWFRFCLSSQWFVCFVECQVFQQMHVCVHQSEKMIMFALGWWWLHHPFSSPPPLNVNSVDLYIANDNHDPFVNDMPFDLFKNAVSLFIPSHDAWSPS